MKKILYLIGILTVVLLAGCAKKPTGANVPIVSNAGQVQSSAKANVTIPFSCSSTLLSQAEQQNLTSSVKYLTTNRNANVVLESTTPDTGSVNLNVANAQARAQAVADYLKIQGVAASQIKIASYGGALTMDSPAKSSQGCQVVLVF